MSSSVNINVLVCLLSLIAYASLFFVPNVGDSGAVFASILAVLSGILMLSDKVFSFDIGKNLLHNSFLKVVHSTRATGLFVLIISSLVQSTSALLA
jgi:Na+(H+)/acetate symporter ActP